MLKTNDHEEPAESEREYFRNTETGELAYLVRQAGKRKLRLNRPNEVILRAFNEAFWVKDEQRYDLLPMQRALVALEADKALCKLLGLIPQSRRDWTRMRDQERISWLENGPDPVGDPVRDRVRFQLWRANMRVLEGLR